MSGADGSRLDNNINNSHNFESSICYDVLAARTRAKKNLDWSRSHVVVNGSTGEIVTDKEGNVLTLADMSRSWFCEKGGRNNAFGIVRRLKRVEDFPADVKNNLPKFITLTFESVETSWKRDGAVIKFLNAYRMWAKRQGVEVFGYFWSGEVQKRGALHYHILVLGSPYISKGQLRAWWSYGFVDVRAVSDSVGAFKYLAKYLWKWGHLADDPDNLPDWWFYFSIFSKRRYGFSRFFQLPPIERIPRWLKESLESEGVLDKLHSAKRAVGGGWQIGIRGEFGERFYASPYKVLERKA